MSQKNTEIAIFTYLQIQNSMTFVHTPNFLCSLLDIDPLYDLSHIRLGKELNKGGRCHIGIGWFLIKDNCVIRIKCIRYIKNDDLIKYAYVE